MLKRKKRDLFLESHCTRKKVNNNKDKEEIARDDNVYLNNIYKNTKSKQYYKEEMEYRSELKK